MTLFIERFIVRNMSRLQAKYLFETYGLDSSGIEELGSVFSSCIKPYVKYVPTNDEYVFKTLDVYSYFMNSEVLSCCVRINGADLTRMIGVDNFDEDEQNELYYHKMLNSVEQENLDDDTFWGISVLQYFYHVSSAVMTLAKRQAHLRKLNKVSSVQFVLKSRLLHSSGGRPFGAKGKLSGADLAAVEYNVENFDKIVEGLISRDWYNEFTLICADVKKYADYLGMNVSSSSFYSGKFAFVSSKSAIKYKFLILRYLWKVESGYKDRDLSYEKKLQQYSDKYKLNYLLQK